MTDPQHYDPVVVVGEGGKSFVGSERHRHRTVLERKTVTELRSMVREQFPTTGLKKAGLIEALLDAGITE